MSDTERDGFVIRDLETGEEIHFVACDDNHPSNRNKVLAGILRNMRDGLVVHDTRDDDTEGREP